MRALGICMKIQKSHTYSWKEYIAKTNSFAAWTPNISLSGNRKKLHLKASCFVIISDEVPCTCLFGVCCWTVSQTDSGVCTSMSVNVSCCQRACQASKFTPMLLQQPSGILSQELHVWTPLASLSHGMFMSKAGPNHAEYSKTST